MEGREAYGGGGTPEEEKLVRGGRGGAGVGELEVVFGVEAVGGGGDGEGEDTALVEGDVRGEESSGCAWDGGVGSKGAVFGELGCNAEGVCCNVVAFLEGCDGVANIVDDAGDVAAKNDWVFFDEGAIVLHLPVDGIDGPSFVRDQDFIGSRFGDVGLFDAEIGGFGIEPCCLLCCHTEYWWAMVRHCCRCRCELWLRDFLLPRGLPCCFMDFGQALGICLLQTSNVLDAIRSINQLALVGNTG